MTAGFMPFLVWIAWMRIWQGNPIALTLAATTLRDRFVVRAIAVVSSGIGMTVLHAGHSHAWRDEWLRMLQLLHPAILQDGTVLVLVDRGLYACWLVRQIVQLG